MLNLDLKVNLNGLDEKLQKKSTEINKKLVKLNSDIVDIAHLWVQRKAPRKTGKLKSSIQKKKSGTSGSVWNDLGIAPYGDYVLDGTSPHIIKGHPYLSWAGAEHPVRQVHHPGTRPNPFFEKAFPVIESKANQKIRVFEEWLTEV
ncbi:MAG: hypothetical protein ISP01_05245 [Methanobrevibacter arboriphilus]|uniref:HK97 gp10 family phage protein n=1 Tax=Methanobrevibacter arboriphilus TaxID=39441 RepID=A0A843AFW7_METAZ|nr:hypothetical protein [Methanobrevibacter arboriphilus]MBF4468793.1 hypothetical protein [Methanobrevibacter arboriphilus]